VPIIGTEELYRARARVCVWEGGLIVCNIEIPTVKWLRLDFDFCSREHRIECLYTQYFKNTNNNARLFIDTSRSELVER
jgi:hypothetical protein